MNLISYVTLAFSQNLTQILTLKHCASTVSLTRSKNINLSVCNFVTIVVASRKTTLLHFDVVQ